MNKKITIYDLLGLIKDGKPPKKIIYDNKKYFIEVHDYSLNDEKVFWLFKDNNIIQIMTKKVEIIEEDKSIIEKLNIENDSPTHFYITNEYGTKCGLTKHSKMIADKLNEIIDVVNKLVEDNEY